MNKRITKKIFAALAVATFFIGGVNAQILTDFVEATAGVESVDTVTISSTTRLYVYPDVYYAPTYARATNTNIGSNEWTWYNSVDNSGPVIKAAANENWIEFTWPATAQTYPVAVYESTTGAGGCEGSVSTINVEVIGTPTVTYTADNAGADIIGTDISVCESDAARLTDIVQLAFTQAGIIGNPSYQAQYTLTVDTIALGDGAPVAPVIATESFLGSAGTQVASNAATLDLAQPVDHGDGAGFVCITNAGGESRSTVYTYSLTGVNDRISRKSDYNGTWEADAGYTPGLAYDSAFDNWTWYDTTAETIAITVNPVPVTGPIYHISNMWAN